MIHKTAAVVIGRRAFGESDRLVDFYTLAYGKVRGIARAARRSRSRFGSALELFTLGELVFFDSGRTELVQVDHFDIVIPFIGVREDLERLGHGAWIVESLARLSADRDPHPALFHLLVRALRSLESTARPRWTAVCLAVRAIDLIGHRPRLDQCVSCHRPFPFEPAALDVSAGGLVCQGCSIGTDAVPLSGAGAGALKRLRSMRWNDALALRVASDLERELSAVTEAAMARLAGQPARSTRFLGQVRRTLARVAEPRPPRIR